MRIISGKFKSRKFNYKLASGIRPTTDMAKESLFNVLDNLFDYQELKVLDLYSGSGSVGFEFISRGAEFVHFNDINTNSINFIKRIISELKIENYKISKNKAVSTLENNIDNYNLFFMDPPYFSLEYSIIENLVNNNIKKFKGKYFIIEFDASKNIEWNFELIKEKAVSSSKYKIYKIN